MKIKMLIEPLEVVWRMMRIMTKKFRPSCEINQKILWQILWIRILRSSFQNSGTAANEVCERSRDFVVFLVVSKFLQSFWNPAGFAKFLSFWKFVYVCIFWKARSILRRSLRNIQVYDQKAERFGSFQIVGVVRKSYEDLSGQYWFVSFPIPLTRGASEVPLLRMFR